MITPHIIIWATCTQCSQPKRGCNDQWPTWGHTNILADLHHRPQ